MHPKFYLFRNVTLLLLFLDSIDIMAVGIIKRVRTQLCKEDVTLELAVNPTQRQRGLMFRKGLSGSQGMIFVYSRAQFVSFWMKNVSFPISIGFFNDQGELLESQEMATERPRARLTRAPHRLYKSKAPVRYAVEMRRNWFKGREKCFLDVSPLTILPPIRKKHP